MADTDEVVDTQLFEAAGEGRADTVRDLIQTQGADPNYVRTFDGATPILVAAFGGHVEVVRALGELGADPDLARTDYGTTPIIMAALSNHLAAVRALLELGADRKGVTMINFQHRFKREVLCLLETPVPQPHREQIRIELDDKIEEVQIIELVADFVGPLCDPKRRKAYIVECAQHRAEIKKQKQK